METEPKGKNPWFSRFTGVLYHGGGGGVPRNFTELILFICFFYGLTPYAMAYTMTYTMTYTIDCTIETEIDDDQKRISGPDNPYPID